MGRSYSRKDGWYKKDRRDQNFKKSKKFKEKEHDHNSKNGKKPSIVDLPPITDDTIIPEDNL